MIMNMRTELVTINKTYDLFFPPCVFLHEYSLHLLAKGDHGKLCS